MLSGGKYPFAVEEKNYETVQDWCQAIKDAEYVDLPDSISLKTRELIKKILDKNYTRRPSVIIIAASDSIIRGIADVTAPKEQDSGAGQAKSEESSSDEESGPIPDDTLQAVIDEIVSS